jgi:hypothetical protein
VSGPTHVAYPPRLAEPDYDEIIRPAGGLIGAMLTSIRPYVHDLPHLEAHHDQAAGVWKIQVRPIKRPRKVEMLEQKTRRMLAAFRRGAFRTELPSGDAIDEVLLTKLGMHGMLVNDRDEAQISVASYMLTTLEVNALQSILSAGHAVAHAHYELALRDTLETAVIRQAERDDSARQRVALSIGETISGLIQTPRRVLWIRGCTTAAAHKASAAWASFTEPTSYFDT